MKSNHVALITGLCLALSITWQIDSARAASPCKFSAGAAGFGAKGNTAALIASGSVEVATPAVYNTKYLVEVGVWVDADLAALDPNIPALALSYYEHANCIFALGVNANTSTGIHDMSLRIAGNRIRYFVPTSPKVPGQNAYWVQRTHQDWQKAIKALGPAAPKVNLLFSASSFVELGPLGPGGAVTTWTPNGGASNGVGQGQALARVDPAAYKNGGKLFNQDWWGVIAAHELGHALGVDFHQAIKLDNMCCPPAAPYTTEPGNTESYKFSMSQTSWDPIVANNAATTDNFSDPYATTPNPVTHEKWSFPQVHQFLVPSSFENAVIWRYTGTPCGAAGCPGWQPLDQNTRAVAIAASDDRLYQLHSDGALWRYTGAPCSGVTCDGWQKLDANPRTRAIAAGSANLYQLHSDGAIWRYTGTPCNPACNGWQKLDANPKAVALAAAGNELYQLHNDGAIWRYTGTPCNPACNGWQKLDANPKGKAIVAAGNELYQLHSDGALWRYTGTPCNPACNGWQKLDANPKTRAIAAGGADLYQLHSDGALWRYTGTPCSAAGCPGWQKLDTNPKTKAIIAGPSLYQLH